jgi:hypothetical protein
MESWHKVCIRLIQTIAATQQDHSLRRSGESSSRLIFNHMGPFLHNLQA